MFKKIDAMYMKFTLMLTMCFMAAFPMVASAAQMDTALLGRGDELDLGGKTVEWPWTRILNSLAAELTGPLPLVLGLLGVSVAALALLFGNGGAGTQKALLLIGAVSVAMFTPTLVQYIYASASGATVDMVIGATEAVTTIAPPPLP